MRKSFNELRYGRERSGVAVRSGHPIEVVTPETKINCDIVSANRSARDRERHRYIKLNRGFNFERV